MEHGFKGSIKRVSRAVKALTPSQRDSLDATLAELGEARSAEVLRVILWTGLRVSEALALESMDFDAHRRELRVSASKTDAGVRFVDVPDCVVDTLRSYLGRPAGSRPHATTLRRRLKQACKASEVPQIRVHDLRHTRITTQLLAGVPVGYVSKQAGHATPAFTLDVYDHWAQAASHELRRQWANAG